MTRIEFLPKLSTKGKLFKYWSNILQALDIFWKIWRNEYLASLRKRIQRENIFPRNVEVRLSREEEIVLVNKPEFLPRYVEIS